ncbi:MAG: hypothetical protein Kow0054_04220 [Deferrisoma sp.]
MEAENLPVSTTQPLEERIEHFLRGHYGMHHITLQLELDRCESEALA